MSQREGTGFDTVIMGVLAGAVLYIVAGMVICAMDALNTKAAEQTKRSSVERRRHNELIRTIEESK